MTTAQTIETVHIPVYMWDDIVDLFPEGFADVAYEALENSNKVSFGDAEYTIIKGTLAQRILFDAWDEWDEAGDHDRTLTFGRLPSLINAQVALRG